MSSSQTQPRNSGSARDFDVVIVGAGFSGLYQLHLLRGLGFSCRVIEAAAGVGGTWYWNRYPGASCDIESMVYSYSFSNDLQQEWKWSDRYPSQPEVLSYIEHVVDRFDLQPDIQLETRVTRAVFDEASNRWIIHTDRGESLTGNFCVMATGCLSAPKRPEFKGLASFEGDWYHTGYWPHEEVDFTGKRVGVIGTGSSGIQAIPYIAEQASHLTVFQRTPNFSIPAWNGPLDPGLEREIKANYPQLRHQARWSLTGEPWDVKEKPGTELSSDQQQRVLEKRWQEGGLAMLIAFGDLLTCPQTNQLAAEFCRKKIRERVTDPAIAELLCPKDHPFGTKRLCVDTGYYETYNRENVTLVDVKHSPIDEITPKGLRTGGTEFELDAIVFATGFDAMTGALHNIDICGRAGQTLKQKWADGPRTYLGISTAGFPNLFKILGPGSPSVLSNMMVSIEQHVEWIAECIEYMRRHQLDCIEPTVEAQDQWVEHVSQTAQETLYPQANSWYMGANIPGKARVFLPYAGTVSHYRTTCNEVASNGYQGFTLSAGSDKENRHGHPAHPTTAGATGASREFWR